MRRRSTVAIVIFFVFFSSLRVFSHGLPPIEVSFAESTAPGGSLYGSIGGWTESVEESGLLAELQGSRLMVPPRNFEWVTPVLGIGTTQTWKRFSQPSHEWLRAIWQFCDQEFTVSSVDKIQALARDHPNLSGDAQRCYKTLETEQVMALARKNGADFALVYLASQSELPAVLLDDGKWGLVRVD